MVYFDKFSNLFQIQLKNKLTYTVQLGNDANGNITRIDNVINSLNKQLVVQQELLENIKKQLSNAKQECQKKFPQEEELKIKSKRLNELNITLNLDKKDYEIIGDENIEPCKSEKYPNLNCR